MRRLWLLFAQTVTVGLAILFIVATLKPEWAGGVFGTAQKVRSATSIPMLEAPPNTAPIQSSYREAAKLAMPSVVNIFTSKTAAPVQNPFLDDPFFRKFFGDRFDEEQEKQVSLGSGVIVSAQGYILTHNPVVEAADEIEVALADGRKALAKVVGSDPETDLAVVKIDLDNLPAITLGRIEEARENAKLANVTDKVTFLNQDLFESNISDATVVTLYLLPSLNEKLMPKLKKELKPGTRVVSHAFSMGAWEPDEKREIGGRTIYLWRIR